MLSPIPILFIDSLEHQRKGEGITGEEREDSLPRIDNFLRGENNGIFHRLLIGAEQTIAWSWFREIRPRSEKFSWKGGARVALYVVNYERERSHETSSVHVRASREIPIRSRARV